MASCNSCLGQADLKETLTDVHEKIGKFGKVNKVWLHGDFETKTCTGKGFVFMNRYEDACEVVEFLSVSLHEDIPLTAKFAGDRRRNLIIFMDEEEGEDLEEKVGALLGHLQEETQLLGTAHRLGAASATNRRITKVTLESEALVDQILSKAKLLRGVEGFSRTNLARDRGVTRKSPDQS